MLCFMLTVLYANDQQNTRDACPGGTYSTEAATHTYLRVSQNGGYWGSGRLIRNPFNLKTSGSCRATSAFVQMQKLQMCPTEERKEGLAKARRCLALLRVLGDLTSTASAPAPDPPVPVILEKQSKAAQKDFSRECARGVRARAGAYRGLVAPTARGARSRGCARAG